MSLVLYANNERSTNTTQRSNKNLRAISEVETLISLTANFVDSSLSAAALSTIKNLETLSAITNFIDDIVSDIQSPFLSSYRIDTINTYYHTLTSVDNKQAFVFYRKKSDKNYDIIFKLTEQNHFANTESEATDSLSSLYVAEYKINDGSFQPMTNVAPFTITSNPMSGVTVGPVLCSVVVQVSGLDRTSIPAQNFSFTYNPYTLSATALFFESWTTDDVFAFYWNVTADRSASLTPLISTDELLDQFLLDGGNTASYYIVSSIGNSQSVLDLLSTVEAITGKVINIYELPMANSSAEMVYSVQRSLVKFENLTALSASSNTLQIIQNDFQSQDTLVRYPVSTVNVDYSYRLPALSGDVTIFAASAVFLDEIPQVDFLLYPNFTIIETQPLSSIDINSENFQFVLSGLSEAALSFCGEGHSQLFHLSGTMYNASTSENKNIIWYVGNEGLPVFNTTKSKFFVSLSSIEDNQYLATTVIKTSAADDITYPVAAFAIDPSNYIDINSPATTYPDTTQDGDIPPAVYYPYYYSTKNIDGEFNRGNTTFKNNIKVLPYPIPVKTNVYNPFDQKSLKLPFDTTSKQFVATKTFSNAITSICQEKEVKTQWQLKAKATNDISWSIDATTDPYVENYIFDLIYDEDQNTDFLPLFTATKYTDTSITLGVSCIKTVSLELNGFSTSVFSFSYSPSTLSSSALVFQDVLGNNTVYAFYWGTNDVSSHNQAILDYQSFIALSANLLNSNLSGASLTALTALNTLAAVYSPISTIATKLQTPYERLETLSAIDSYYAGFQKASIRNNVINTVSSTALNYQIFDLQTASSTTDMVTGVYAQLSSLSTISVIQDVNTITITQKTLSSETFPAKSLGRILYTKQQLPLYKKDWKPRNLTQAFNFTTKILPQPLTLKLYTPNFYNLKETQIPFVIHYEEHGNFKLSAVDVSCSLAASGIRLYPITKKPNEILFKTNTDYLFFNKVGLADIKMTAYVFDANNPDLFIFERTLNDVVEIIEHYDIIQPESYYTFLAPPTFSETEAPLLSPNEWLISDNVNDSLKRLYKTFEELNYLTYLYTNKSNFYSWISHQQTPSDPLLNIKKYTWEDLECKTDTELEDQYVWFNFECENPNDEDQAKNITWEQHFCKLIPDPDCRQKYCLEWKWKKRKAKESKVKVSWKTARKGNAFEKRWRYEGCDADSKPLNCNKIRWNYASFDKRAFPLPYAGLETTCRFTDIDYIESLDAFVVAHPKEIKLFKNDLESTYLGRRGSVDQLFAFQDIAGIAVNSEGRIYALDRILCKVSVLQYSEGSLATYDSWGNFGLRDNPLGFNKPEDIHIDQDNFIWIADTGNKCIKKFTSAGRPVTTITNETFAEKPPKSLCVDSQYNLHVLVEGQILVFDRNGDFSFAYSILSEIESPTKINTNYSREIVYIVYASGVAKYFRDGDFFGYLIKDYVCGDAQTLEGFGNILQDKYRNSFVVATNKILKIGDLMKTIELKGHISDEKYWSLEEILVDKNEYVQPWVYLRGFERLWDNIELIRSALFYNINECKTYNPPVYEKEQLILGQNELVTNTVLNRLIKQIWENIETLKKYFDVNCEKKLK